MKVLSIFLGFITVSDCASRQKLAPIKLSEDNEVPFTQVISAEIGQIQDFICPPGRDSGGYEFSLFLVSNEAYRQCETQHEHRYKQLNILNCNNSRKEIKVCGYLNKYH